jgi:hypothetical protein
MTTHNIQIRKGFRWLRVLPGVALFALAACTEMMQPAAPHHSDSRRTAWFGCYARRT